jgi:hypothetical protein
MTDKQYNRARQIKEEIDQINGRINHLKQVQSLEMKSSHYPFTQSLDLKADTVANRLARKFIHELIKHCEAQVKILDDEFKAL